jgi:hypothetical protein
MWGHVDGATDADISEHQRKCDSGPGADEFCCSLRRAAGTISALARSQAADLQSQ